MIDYSFTYSDLQFFLLIFVRISCFIVSAPFFSMNTVPRRVKAGIAFWISLLLFTAMPKTEIMYDSVVSLSVIVIKEALAGLVIGLGANICLSITNLAGKLADMEVGLSMVQMFDPMTRESTGFMGSIYMYAVMLILLITNMHHIVLRTFIDGYDLIPVGAVTYTSEDIVSTTMRFMADYVSIAFRFCLPVVASIMILNTLLGILAKVAPQMNMFAVGIQIKIFVGFAIIILTIGLMPALSGWLFKEMKLIMDLFIRSLTSA